jgi:hypothetical protein
MTHTPELFDFVNKTQIYENIVFMQGSDADKALKIFDEKGHDALLEHLLQWDIDDSNVYSETPPWGTRDQVIVYPKMDCRLVLSINTRLSYCGLCRVKNKEEKYAQTRGQY